MKISPFDKAKGRKQLLFLFFLDIFFRRILTVSLSICCSETRMFVKIKTKITQPVLENIAKKKQECKQPQAIAVIMPFPSFYHYYYLKL